MAEPNAQPTTPPVDPPAAESTPPAQPTPSVPQVTPPPVAGVSEDEVNRRIEAVRQEEKNKLYKRIETLQTENKTKDEELNKVSIEVASIKKEIESKEDVSLSDQEKSVKAMNRLTNQVSDLQTKLDKSQKEMQKRLDSANIKAYIEKKISSMNGECIPELIRGSNEEEINIAADASKKKYQEIIKKGTSTTPVPLIVPSLVQPVVPAKGVTPPPESPTGPTSPAATPAKTMDVHKIASMPDKDWKENREAMMEAAANSFNEQGK